MIVINQDSLNVNIIASYQTLSAIKSVITGASPLALNEVRGSLLAQGYTFSQEEIEALLTQASVALTTALSKYVVVPPAPDNASKMVN